MKLNKWLYGAMTLGMFAACSSDDAPINGNQPEKTPDGFISVNMELPTTTGTRAANDEFDHGSASEYNVNEGILVLFKGTSESNATFIGAYDLGFPKPNLGQDENVSASYKRAVKVTGASVDKTKGEKLYGLVLVNQSEANIFFGDNNILNVGENKCGASTTFTQFLKYTSEKSFTDVTTNGNVAKSIFMANSPLSPVKGGETAIDTDPTLTTLVELSDAIYTTEAEAMANPAGTIYLERAVAKLTMTKFLKQTAIGDGISSGITVNENKGLTITGVQWALGNEESSSYFVRNIGKIDWKLNTAASTESGLGTQYRMIGGKGVLKDITKTDATAERLYRPYWGIDPNYNQNKYSDNGEEYKKMRDFINWNSDQVFYCHENTFNVENMTYGNTTRVGIWVTFNLDGSKDPVTFYTRNQYKETIYFDTKEGDVTYNPLKMDAFADLSKNEDLKNAWVAALNTEGTGSASFNPKEHLEITTVIDETEGGLLKITGITFSDKNKEIYKDSKLPTFDFNTIITILNNTYKYHEYKDGKAFYEVRIKHFGDDLTPWSTDKAATTIDEAYPADNRNNKYLGRYGMLRNNWYDLNINSLSKIGEPRDPAQWDKDWKKTPDDNKDQYISVSINVLSWAKRTQNVEF